MSSRQRSQQGFCRQRDYLRIGERRQISGSPPSLGSFGSAVGGRAIALTLRSPMVVGDPRWPDCLTPGSDLSCALDGHAQTIPTLTDPQLTVIAPV